MPPPSDRPLQKVTLNLFRDDVAALVARFGNGWTTEIRMIVSAFVREKITHQMELPDGN